MSHFAFIILMFLTWVVLSPIGLAAERISVFVSIPPQKYYVQQIGADRVDVQVMVQPGASPATYEPKPRQMAALSKAAVYFAIGVPFENAWLDKIAAANPEMKMVHTDQGIRKLPMGAHHHHEGKTAEHHAGHHHQDGENDHQTDQHHEKDGHETDHHQHAGLDPHIWLSPPLVKLQARTILAALQQIDPVHQDAYAANFAKFAAQIDRLDARLQSILAGRQGMQFMVFHPSWAYFARTYGLQQVPVEIEGRDPKPAQLQELIEHARQKGIRVVFVQPQFSTSSAKLVARAIEGEVAVADPLAEDWAANLRRVAQKIKAALK